jgi:arginine utilization protein RocB
MTRQVEANAFALSSETREDWVGDPPPVTLYQTDLRTAYDVTTPAAAWCSYNVLGSNHTPQQVLAAFVDLARAAMGNAVALLQQRAAQYAALQASPGLPQPNQSNPQWQSQPRVLTFAELKALCGPAQASAYAQALAEDQSLDNVTLSQKLIAALVREAKLEGPAAIVCFASLYYPPVGLGHTARDASLREIVSREAAQLSSEGELKVSLQPIFSGISDMSFVACRDDDAAIATVTENTPPWGTRLRYDYALGTQLNVPIVNIGPWGADYHQKTERVHMAYSFGVVPELLWRVAKGVIGEEA